MSQGNEVQEMRARGDLKVLCVMFLFWNAFAILLDPPYWAISPGSEHLISNPSHYTFLLAIFLWLRWPAGRALAVGCTWWYLLVALVIFLQSFDVPSWKIKGPVIFPDAPLGAKRMPVVPWFLALLWQLWTLRRPAFRALFVSRRRAVKEDATARQDSISTGP